MLAWKVLDVQISDCLKQKLNERAVASGLSDSLPGILWGKWDDEVNEYYFIGFHERAEIPTGESHPHHRG